MSDDSNAKRDSALDFLDELDGRHDFLLNELEQLNQRIDLVLSEYSKSRQPTAQAIQANENQPRDLNFETLSND